MADAEHPEGEVGRDDVDTGVGERLAARAGAGGDVEDALAGARVARGDDGPAPQPVLAEGEDVVRHVVAVGDVVEHRRDVAGVLLEGGAGHGGHPPTDAGGPRTAPYRCLLMTSLPAGRPPPPHRRRTPRRPPSWPGPCRWTPRSPRTSWPSSRGGPTDACSWVRRGEGLVGWGRAASHVAVGPDRFGELERWWSGLVDGAVVRDEVDLPGTGPVAFGSVAYAAGSSEGGTLVVPEVVVGRRGDVAWLTTMSAGAAVPGAAEVAPQPAPPRPVDVAFSDGALSPADWSAAVATAVGRITAGDLDKVVLARDLGVTTRSPLDVRWLLHRLAERYDTTWVFAVDGLVGATPELLVRREKGLVTSRVLAGTIRPTGDDAHDPRSRGVAGALVEGPRGARVRRAVRGRRARAALLVDERARGAVRPAPLQRHAPGHRRGRGARRRHLVADPRRSLHPSAAVCGTPRLVADDVITELEHMDRGRYAGPVGWIDADGDGEWGIALRCGAVDRDDASRMRLFAGCGIVAGSDPDDELAESSAKLVPMRDALTADAP